jgi:hypothetical protein
MRVGNVVDIFFLDGSVVMNELWWGLGGRRETWQWRRQLWAWKEGMLKECRNLLYDMSLQSNISYHWLWRHDSCGGYSV